MTLLVFYITCVSTSFNYCSSKNIKMSTFTLVKEPSRSFHKEGILATSSSSRVLLTSDITHMELGFYSVVVRILDVEFKSLTLNLSKTLNKVLSHNLIFTPCHSTLLKRDTIMYRLNWREYMVEWNINLDLITIIASSLVSIIIFFCSFVFQMFHFVETRIMELFVFQR